MDEITLQLNSPLTDEQWGTITDVDFDHTDRITFHTKHGKEVDFVKFKPIKTNADRIRNMTRNMTDEELAFYIFNHPQWVDLDGYLNWLKQEAVIDAKPM